LGIEILLSSQKILYIQQFRLLEFSWFINMATRRKDSDLTSLAARAERAKTDGDPSGFISSGFGASDFSIVLGGCIDFNPDLPEFEIKRIVTRIALDSTISRPITADSLLKQCAKLEREYFTLPTQQFRLLTEISIGWTIEIPRTITAQTNITFNPKTVRGFTERSRLFRDCDETLGFTLPNHYMRLSASVSARTPYEASEKALNGIDLVRASWNLALNRGKAWRRTSGRPSPVNDIRLSPFHTVHNSTGALATENYWYDPGFTKPASLYSDKLQFTKLQMFGRDLRTKLSQSPYRKDIELALLRYVRALDSADLNDTFLKLWGLLEYLTDSGNDPYKVASRRAAFMFKDRERAQLVLAHLTQHRNRFVHAGSDSSEIEALVFLLKRNVDSLLLFHLGNPIGFTNRSEAALFMDLPAKKDDIDIQIKRLRSARKFISSGS
jgi:hypothetical protein